MRIGDARMRMAVASLAAWFSWAAPAAAIFWNNDPAHGVTSTTGLTDRIDWFQNVHAINNTSNNTMGTTTLLNPEWAITVRHVVQNGSNYIRNCLTQRREGAKTYN